MNEQIDTSIHCPKCNSINWSCWDERSRDCWDKDGMIIGTRVIGGLKCKDCGHDWLDYSVDPAIDNPDCECEDF